MTNGINEIRICEVCGHDNLTPVLDLGMHPMCDDLVRVGDARKCREYPIEILFCDRCKTAHQRFQVPKQDLFPRSYHYRSRFTADVVNGMANLARCCEKRFGNLSGKTVLDIGCNDGSLLDFFRMQGAATVGVEPTGACAEAADKGHITYNEFLTKEVASAIVRAHGTPDFITFTNVFAHIEDLNQLLESLRQLIGQKTIIVIENHYLGAILGGNQFDTFYHEHPRSYSYTSFVSIARSLKMQLYSVQFPSRYGGNIRVFLGPGDRAASSAVENADLILREQQFLNRFDALRENVQRWRENKMRLIEGETRQHGLLRAKAFPGRAAILAKLLSLDEKQVSAVYEKPGSLKIGHYVPGTRIPICSDDDLFGLADLTVPILNFAWHIRSEIQRYMLDLGYTGPIIDILSVEDFGAR